MTFVASKLLAFAVQPLFWVLLPLLCAVLVLPYRRRLGTGLAWAALLALLLSLWTPIPVALMHRLETRYPAPAPNTDLRPYVGVVLLGGALAHSDIWTAHRQVALNDQAERMTAAVALARRNPHLKILYTGGIGSVAGTGLTEAARAKIFFDQMGVDPAQLLYEDQSRNTYENALLSAQLTGVDKTRRWLLLTSANHMPRSMGVFRHTGWNVTPYPVDYRTTGEPDWLDFSFRDGPGTWHTVLHEMVGYQAYRWLGWI